MSSPLDHPDVTAIALGEPAGSNRDFGEQDGLALEVMEIRETADLLRHAFATEPTATLTEEQREAILSHEPAVPAVISYVPMSKPTPAWVARERRQRWQTAIGTGAVAALFVACLMIYRAPRNTDSAAPSTDGKIIRFDKVNLLEPDDGELDPTTGKKRANSHNYTNTDFLKESPSPELPKLATHGDSKKREQPPFMDPNLDATKRFEAAKLLPERPPLMDEVNRIKQEKEKQEKSTAAPRP